jgi:SAM-dependent methyltransferase
VRTFADACQAIIDAPGAEHSLYTTLAPLYESLMTDADDHYRRQFRLARRRLPLGTDSVLEVGCGVGGLLPLLAGAYGEVCGLDRHPDLLTYAARRSDAALVAADVACSDCELDQTFDAALAFEYVLSEQITDGRVRAFLRTLRRHLRPGGRIVCDAVLDPVAVREDAVGVYQDGEYRLERAVDVVPKAGPTVEVVTDYRATHRPTGESATATERTTIRTFTTDLLRTAFVDAEFVDVRIDESADEPDTDDGTAVVAATRPVETG